MKTTILIIFALSFPFYLKAQCASISRCNYIFTVWDTFGDGWEGNTLSVYQNGDLIQLMDPNLMPDGSYTEENKLDYVVPLCNDSSFSLVWNLGGDHPAEVEVSVTGPTGIEGYRKPFGLIAQGSVLYTAIADCSQLGTSPFNSNIAATYPNPVRDHITIETLSEIKSVQLTSLTGQIVLYEKKEGKKIKVMTNNLSPGMYILLCEFTDGRIDKKKLLIQ